MGGILPGGKIDMGSLTYLFAAFTVIWLAVLLYSFSIASRQKSVQRELEMLRTIVEERDPERLGG